MRRYLNSVALVAMTAAPTAAQGPVGTLVVAHGGGPTWDAAIESVAEAARTDGPMEVSFLMGPGAESHRFQDAARRLVERGAACIVIVPFFVSSHSGHYQQLRYLAGETDDLDATMLHHLHMFGIERPNLDVPVRLAPAIDHSQELAAVLSDRARSLASEASEQALYLIAHGPNSAEDHAQWMRNLRVVARRVERDTGFRYVRVGLMRDDAPADVRAEAIHGIRETISLLHETTARPVVVVPILVSTSEVSEAKVPMDLEGLAIEYDGRPLLPHPAMVRWLELSVESARSPS